MNATREVAWYRLLGVTWGTLVIVRYENVRQPNLRSNPAQLHSARHCPPQSRSHPSANPYPLVPPAWASSFKLRAIIGWGKLSSAGRECRSKELGQLPRGVDLWWLEHMIPGMFSWSFGCSIHRVTSRSFLPPSFWIHPAFVSAFMTLNGTISRAPAEPARTRPRYETSEVIDTLERES